MDQKQGLQKIGVVANQWRFGYLGGGGGRWLSLRSPDMKRVMDGWLQECFYFVHGCSATIMGNVGPTGFHSWQKSELPSGQLSIWLLITAQSDVLCGSSDLYRRHLIHSILSKPQHNTHRIAFKRLTFVPTFLKSVACNAYVSPTIGA